MACYITAKPKTWGLSCRGDLDPIYEIQEWVRADDGYHARWGFVSGMECGWVGGGRGQDGGHRWSMCEMVGASQIRDKGERGSDSIICNSSEETAR